MSGASSTLRALSAVATPLDVVRRGLLATSLQIPGLSALVQRRDRRLSAIAALQITLAFAFALYSPSLLLVLGPIAFGVAHVAADVRYLVLRRKLPRSFTVAVVAGCLALFALRLVAPSASGGFLRLELGLVSVWLCVAAASGYGVSRSRVRLALVSPFLLGFAALALTQPDLLYRGFVHGHNLMALVLWLWLFRERLRSVLFPLALLLAGATLLGSGALARVTLFQGAPELLGLHVLAAADTLAPGLPTLSAVGLTTCFAFLQSVHYAVWLVFVPQEDASGQGTLTFRMSARSFVRDFGSEAALLVIATATVVAVAGVFAPLGTQRAYLSLAFFHGYLELALFAFFATRGRGHAAPAAASPRRLA